VTETTSCKTTHHLPAAAKGRCGKRKLLIWFTERFAIKLSRPWLW